MIISSPDIAEFTGRLSYPPTGWRNDYNESVTMSSDFPS